MDCPDENAIARIQAGKASAQEQAEFHQHLDRCPECMELLELLSRLDDRSSAKRHHTMAGLSPEINALHGKTACINPSNQPAVAQRQTKDLFLTTVIMALTHVSCALLVVPTGMRYVQVLRHSADGLDAWGTLRLISATGIGLCLVMGPAVALIGLYALRANRRWVDTVLRTYAVIAAAALLLAPLAACLLVLLARKPAQSPTRVRLAH